MSDAVPLTDAVVAVATHVAGFFAGHDIERVDWQGGPVHARVPAFRVLVVGPGPRLPGLWTYVTLGCWDAAHDERQLGSEFVLIAPEPSDRHARTLAMVAFYNAGPEHQRLEVGDTLSLGEPWAEAAAADHLLLSLPYPFGATFEWCHWRDGSARLVWLLPITEREHEFKRERGLDALEQRFDEVRLEYWSPSRASVT